MTGDDLAALFPRLWHTAQDGSWPSLRERGLLSTLALLDLYGVPGAEREAILSRAGPHPSASRSKACPSPSSAIRSR